MIVMRPADAADRDFIVSGWSASYRTSRDCTTPMALYVKHKHEEVNYYLERARCIVAHGETGVLFGFIVFDPSQYAALIGRRWVTLDGYVLYVYVAGPFRRRGIARRLFNAAGISPTQRFGFHCRTRWSAELRSKIPLAVHEPHRARHEEIEHGRRTEAGERQAGEPQVARPDQADEDLAP